MIELADLVKTLLACIDTVLRFLVAVSPFLTAILALLALWQARRVFKEQQTLTARIHDEQSKFAKRQMFVAIFESFKGIRTIDCEKESGKESEPVEIVNMINFLELLGVLYENDVVDRDIVVRAFGQFVIDEYTALEMCQEVLPGHTKSGAEMLNESPSAKSLYRAMQADSRDS